MALAIRQHATVDEYRRVLIQLDELKPGQRVEIIVLADPPLGESRADSFWSSVRAIQVDDLPEDYSTQFEEALYRRDKPE